MMEYKVILIYVIILMHNSWWLFQKCYRILNISEDSNQEEIRKAYIKLVKRYHPDSGTNEANADKFAEVDYTFL